MKTCWTRSISDTKAWLANSSGYHTNGQTWPMPSRSWQEACNFNQPSRTAISSSGTLPVGLLQQIRKQNLGPQLSTPTWTPLASCHQTLRSTTGLCASSWASSTVDQEHLRSWLCHRQRQSFMLSELASEKRFAPGILCRNLLSQDQHQDVDRQLIMQEHGNKRGGIKFCPAVGTRCNHFHSQDPKDNIADLFAKYTAREVLQWPWEL